MGKTHLSKEKSRFLLEQDFPQPAYAVGQLWWGRWDNSPLYRIMEKKPDGFVFQSETHRVEGIWQHENFLVYCPSTDEVIKWMDERNAIKEKTPLDVC